VRNWTVKRVPLVAEKTSIALMKRALLCPRDARQYYIRIILVSLLLLGFLGVAPVVGQDQPTAHQPARNPLDLSPSHREQLLAPIPRQFEWMERRRPAPLFLESLIKPSESPSSLSFLVSLEEEYSDNFEQEADAREEYRTSLNIETVYRFEQGRGFLSLANALSGAYEARAEDTTLGFVNFTLNTGYRLPQMSLALSENFVRGEDLEEASPSGIRRGRNIFWINTVSPQIRYSLSRRTSLDLTYTNTIVGNEGEDQNDSITHAITPNLEHRFSRSWVGRIRYTFTYDDEESIAPSTSHDASAELGYIVSRRLSFSFEVFGEVIERDDDGNGSLFYGTTLGVRYRLTPSLAIFAAAGPTVFDEESDKADVFANWQVGLDGGWQIARNTSLTFTTNQSVENTESEVDDVGVVLTQLVDLRLAHTLFQPLQVSLFATYVRTEFLEALGTDESDEGRKDNFWSTGARAVYTLTPVWSLAVEYAYRRRDSNRNEEEFDENRVMLTLARSFSVL